MGRQPAIRLSAGPLRAPMTDGRGPTRDRGHRSQQGADLDLQRLPRLPRPGWCRLGRIRDDLHGRLKIAAVVRRLRPTIVLAPYWGGPPGRGIGHTDHQAAGYLVSHGGNYAHLRAL